METDLPQATEEIQRLRRQLVRARSPSPSRAASAVLSRVEIERDTAVSDLRRANTQIDVLEEKVKVKIDWHQETDIILNIKYFKSYVISDFGIWEKDNFDVSVLTCVLKKMHESFQYI